MGIYIDPNVDVDDLYDEYGLSLRQRWREHHCALVI